MTIQNLAYLLSQVKTSCTFIPLELLILFESSQDALCIKDINKTICFANEKYKTLAQTNLDGDQPLITHFKQNINIHDDLVLKEQRKIESIGILPINENSIFKFFNCEKLPYYNKNAEIVGIITQIKPIRIISFPDIFEQNQNMGTYTINCPTVLFSEKEWQIIFLILHGMREKEIAQKLNRTLSTIKFHKTNILQKTFCKNTNEFTELAHKNHWNFYVPSYFLKPSYIIKHQ